MPSTLIFSEGNLIYWFFNCKQTNKILMKNNKNLSDYNILKEFILNTENFT